MDKKEFEKYSSAFSLSDMEIYIFPELMYSLVLANIMSPRIWEWKNDSWFKGMEKKSFNYRVQRLKQYIMDHYSFNLDLQTWGLTSKPDELKRFEGVTEPEFLSRSNALFGYEGDKYYFDIDIRRHFGLDQYDGDVIPYWKTETVEAMDAFKYKPGASVGAGECVSLAGLYAAALYIVLDVPLEDIFLMATPLHSQNFVVSQEGVITNNRRIVTKKMWFNGTALSDKARRALEKERVTVVSHISGYSHIDYPQATIEPESYDRFAGKLSEFLRTPVNFEVFASFLRIYAQYRKYFQFEHVKNGTPYYLTAEKLYEYEHSTPFRLGDAPTNKLLREVETEEFDLQPYTDRNIVNLIEQTLNSKRLFCSDPAAKGHLDELLKFIPDREQFCRDICEFSHTAPRLPQKDKEFDSSQARLEIPTGMSRKEIIDYLRSMRQKNKTADLAFYAGRNVDERGLDAFAKCCFERNPVSIEFFKDQSAGQVFERLVSFANESIYDGCRLAVPDEVVNFTRGDGIEKAFCMANVLIAAGSGHVKFDISGQRVVLVSDGQEYCFETSKAVDFSTVEYRA